MDLERMNVLVAGGATAGAAIALLLARAGARVTVLEKVAEPRAVGAGIALAENGLAVLDALGFGPTLARSGCPVEGARVVDGEGNVLLEPRGSQPRVLMVRRSDLHTMLLDALGAERGIELVLGATVESARADGSVVMRTSEGERTVRADLVVGADGVHSRVREGGDFGARVSEPGPRYIRTLVGLGLARGEEAWTSEGLFGSFAVPGGTYVYASAHGPAAQILERRGDLRAWKDAWARAYAPAREILAGLSDWDQLIVNQVVRVDTDRFFDGRLVLAGDAAHAMAPNLGQGANSALVDAAVLVASLRAASDLPAALAAYDARRRPAVRVVADTAGRLGSLAGWTSAPSRFLRDHLIMPLAARFADEAGSRRVMQERPEDLAALCRA